MNSNPSDRPVRIVIADGQPIFRDGLRRLLECRAAYAVAGESAGAAAAVARVRDLVPDVLLLSAANIDLSLLDTLEQIAALDLPVRTIVLTPTLRDAQIAAAVERGARGVMSTQTAADVLFAAIDVVMQGGTWIGLRSSAPNAFGLTPRELEILRAVVNGDTNRAIALRCSISENTVKRHVMHLFDKVGASSRVELALFAQHHELTQGV